MPVLARPPTSLPAEQLEGQSSWAEATGAAFSETYATGPTASIGNMIELSRTENYAWGERGQGFMGSGPRRELSRKLSSEEAQQQVADAGLTEHVPLSKYPTGLRQDTLDLLISLNKDKVRRQTIASQYDGWTPQVAGMVMGSIVDPGNIAVSLVPVVGEARYAAMLKRASGALGRFGVRAQVGAVEGVVGAAAVEPLIYAGQNQWRNDYNAYDSMLNIAGGGVFGAALHGGAGLAIDKFGRKIDVPAPVKVRQPFADPDVYAGDAFRAKARAQGVSDSAIRNLTPKAPRDDVTGFFDGRQANVKTDTVSRALRHVTNTGEPGYFVSADITNLGGLNAHMGNVAEAANVHYKAMTDILDAELRATGGDVVAMRTGGDELGLVVVNADSRAVAEALDRVDERVAQYAQDNDLAAIPHQKRSGEQGVGLHTGVAQIERGAEVSDILRQADLGVNASKRGIDRVTGSARQANRLGPDPGRKAGRMDPGRAGEIRAENAGVARDPLAGVRSREDWLNERGLVESRLDELRPTTRQQAMPRALEAFRNEIEADLTARAGNIAEPNIVANAKTTIATTTRELEALETDRRQIIRQRNAQPGVTRKQAERLADEQIADRRADLSGRKERAEGIVASNKDAADAVAELSAFRKTGAVPESWRDRVNAAADRLTERPAALTDTFLHIRSFVTELDQATQASSLRMALAQIANGQPVDVTPAMLSDPQFRADPTAYAAAHRAAVQNSAMVAGADLHAAQAADVALKEAPRNDTLEEARALLKDDEQRFRDRGGDPATIEVDDVDARQQAQAAKAVSLCLMRHGA